MTSSFHHHVSFFGVPKPLDIPNTFDPTLLMQLLISSHIVLASKSRFQTFSFSSFSLNSTCLLCFRFPTLF
ncbi:hypothetical protein Scep_017556 [Stephania cephalantha]|uniref:Uncharacterized protein n=1 Tax=Stephania cephalantha TaxID=152367 RepID=A0AAP0IR48_9MAGN